MFDYISNYVFKAKPFGKRCSQEAVVTAQSRSPDRQMAVVIAEEEGMILPFMRIYKRQSLYILC